MRKIHKVKKQVTEGLELPKDIMYGAVIVNITGQSEIFIENYRGILQYTTEVIVLQTKTCVVEIHGQKLAIDYYTSDEMKITGRISCVNYNA